jgi:hypothetical protein
MRYLPPTPWGAVTEGEVMLIDGAPRTVLVIRDYAAMPGRRIILADGLQPFTVRFNDWARPVELDESDAIGTLFVAGLNPTPIEGNGS